MIKVHFENVGRGKKNWTADVKSLSHYHLYKEVKKNGGLASKGIDFDIDDIGNGEILVGGFRKVGKFKAEIIQRN